MGTTRLQIYNGALLLCKERSLASLTETCKARSLLDQVWTDGGVRYCLEQGLWQFAMRTQEIGYDPDIDTQFGYTYAFDKPDDWVLTAAVCSDERFKTPLVEYADETDYWTADITPIYVKYVSDDDAFGNDLSRWPESFTNFVQTMFASKIVISLSGAGKLADALLSKDGLLDQARLVAKNRAAWSQPMQQSATGSWVRSRVGSSRRGPMGDGGSGGALTG